MPLKRGLYVKTYCFSPNNSLIVQKLQTGLVIEVPPLHVFGFYKLKRDLKRRKLKHGWWSSKNISAKKKLMTYIQYEKRKEEHFRNE